MICRQQQFSTLFNLPFYTPLRREWRMLRLKEKRLIWEWGEKEPWMVEGTRGVGEDTAATQLSGSRVRVHGSSRCLKLRLRVCCSSVRQSYKRSRAVRLQPIEAETSNKPLPVASLQLQSWYFACIAALVSSFSCTDLIDFRGLLTFLGILP